MAERYHSSHRHRGHERSHSRVDGSGDYRADCQRMLSEFRVHELKDLLRKVGQSQRGKKAELFQRANEILRHGSPKIQIHIREIHQNCRPYRSPQRTHSLSKTIKMAQEMVESRQQDYVVHPDVKFKPHPFFKLLGTIIRPTALVPTSHTPGGGYSMRLQFYLSPTQAQQIYKSKNTHGQDQIIIRFARQETSCEQEDFYPKQCYIKVNEKFVPIPGYIPQYSNRPDYKRNGKPVDITAYMSDSPSKNNDVLIYWNQDILFPQGFCVTIEHVESLSSCDLLFTLKSKGLRSPDISRALVKEKLSIDHDSEIATTSLRISLICPLGKLRMTNPCRSMNCTHLQCFDASIYLQMNERKAQWICPVCDKPAPFKDLFVDGFFKEICEKSNSDTIEFSADGVWKPFSNKVTHSVLTPDSKQKDGPITICGSTPEKVGAGTSSDPIVIDLTLSDSEDEEPIRPSRKSSTSSDTDSTVSNSSSSFSEPIYECDSVRQPCASSTSSTQHTLSTPSHTHTLSNTHESRESCTVSVITQGCSYPQSRLSAPPVNRQGPTRHDVISLQHGYSSVLPDTQDIYHNNITLNSWDDHNPFNSSTSWQDLNLFDFN